MLAFSRFPRPRRWPLAAMQFALLGPIFFRGAQAQQSRQVSFQAVVTDASGAVVPDARLTFRDLGTSPLAQIGCSTGASGIATLSLPTGRYQISVAHAGFQPLTREVDLPQAGAMSAFFLLTVAANTETVNVESGGFHAEMANSAARMPLALLDTPQQMDMLTDDLLRSRAVDSMKQAVEIVPSVGLQLGEGRRDNFFLRGFNAVGDMYLDGVRDDAQYYRDLSNTERIEILEGPAAALYGRGSSGGLINRISKKPRMEGTLAQLSYTAGSYGNQRGVADLDTLLPGTHRKLGFRLTGASEHEGSQRHFFWADRYTFAPTLAWRPSENTTVTAQAERLRDDRLPDRGIPYLPETGSPAPVPVGTFYGYVGPEPGNNFIHTAVTGGTLDAKHTTANAWNLHAVERLAGYATNFDNLYPSAVITSADGALWVARGEYNGSQQWSLAFTDLEASTSARWLGTRHSLLIGTEYGRETTVSQQRNGPTNQTAVRLFDPALTPPVLSSTLSRNNRFLGQTVAVFGQDLVDLAPHWKALIGVRFDDFLQALDLRPPTNTTPNLGRTDLAGSPRVGLVYQPRPWASVYGNYSRTFDPSGENLSLAANNADLKPELTQNLEGGAKFQLLRQRLLLTSSLFRLNRTNIKTTDPANPLLLLNLGEQRSDGAEFNFQGALAHRWQVYGGYAWLDGRIVSSTTVSNGVSLQGRRPAMNPLHSGSLWTTYSFPDGFGFGAGLIARASQFAATDNLARLPAYARIDASAFFRHARYELQANLENAGNLRYYDAAQSDFQIYPAAPVSGTLTFRYSF